MPNDLHRNIVLFSDGTGNSASSVFKTNVRRLYEALDLTDPHPFVVPRQFAFYDDGVGTAGFRPLAIMGGAFGYGLARNVRHIYAFLCRTYQPGDKIYGFGFSRGAFTMRLVADMVLNQGIVRYDGDEAQLARDAADTYRAYRKKFQNAGEVAQGGSGKPSSGAPYPARCFRAVRDVAITSWRRLRGHRPYERAEKFADPEVKMLGVWDTVDAYGLPIEELTRAVDRFIWPLSFPTANLDRRVGRAYQALCLDDERNTFFPRLWNEHEQGDAQRIVQVWFPGVHADVGGGYADASLAHVPLTWMVQQAEANGLRFSRGIRIQQEALADENGPRHDSRRGFGGYYRYKPRDLRTLTRQEGIPGCRPAVRVELPLIHESVFRRMKDGQDGYAPFGLPETYGVVVAGKDGSETRSGDEYLWPHLTAQERKKKRQDFSKGQDEVWNWIWRRRVAYFVTLFSTLTLVATPLFLQAQGCSSPACFVAPLIVGIGALLPGYASTWLTVMAMNPVMTLAIAAAIAAGLAWGSALQTRIGDEMRQVWYSAAPEWAPTIAKLPPPGRRSVADRFIERIRQGEAGRFHQRLTWRVAPGCALLVIASLALGFASSSTMSILEANGAFCQVTGSAGVPGDGTFSDPKPFDTNEPCHPLGVDVAKGNKYRVRVLITSPWFDGSIPATPNGIAARRDHSLAASVRNAAMTAAVPLRRHMAQPWFKLTLRVGVKGSDTYTPDWWMVSDDARGKVYLADFVATQEGPVYIYVNDAFPLIFSRSFYANNRGQAKVSVGLLGAR